MDDHLKAAYPWAQFPIITNGPMGSIAGPKLATEVTRAGGIGFLGAGYDIGAAEQNLKAARELLSSANAATIGDQLPVGLGVLCFITRLEDILRLVKEYKPVAVWLFAAHDARNDYATWAKSIRDACNTRIWIQTNSVGDALMLAREVKPDALVMQGSDAGGHGAEKGAGVVSLVPETVDALQQAGVGPMLVLAAGGIADGRGIAAAVALGAQGVTMGTRFLASEEAAMTNEAYRTAIIEASDGGQSTLKHKVFDDMNAAGNIWPLLYNGRALCNATSADLANGKSLEENRSLFAQAAKANGGFAASMAESRANAWAGTGVGLIRSVDNAFDIVQKGRNEAMKILRGLSA